MLAVKIISGGQTGVDQAALDFALERGIDCGGWCPKGRICETGRIPDRFPLKEVDSEDYNERTRRNVEDSDATLVITMGGRKEEGTGLTIQLAQRLGRDLYHINIDEEGIQEDELRSLPEFRRLCERILEGNTRILNIAGNRESSSPGINKIAAELLGLVWDYCT